MTWLGRLFIVTGRWLSSCREKAFQDRTEIVGVLYERHFDAHHFADDEEWDRFAFEQGHLNVVGSDQTGVRALSSTTTKLDAPVAALSSRTFWNGSLA